MYIERWVQKGSICFLFISILNHFAFTSQHLRNSKHHSGPHGIIVMWTISYIIPHTFRYWIKSKKKRSVIVCLFRFFTIEQIILNPITVAKHLVVLTDHIHVLWFSQKQLLIATNNCSGRYSEIVTGRYFSIVAR